MRESGIYVHKAIDGNHHLSYDISYEAADLLETPEETRFSTLEYLEGQYLQQDNAEELLQAIPDEEERENPPPQVGTMYFEDQEIENLDWNLPDVEEFDPGIEGENQQ